MSDIVIDCGNNSNGDTSATVSDKVTFHNSLNNKSISLTLPSKQGGCSLFAGNPSSPVTIGEDKDSGQYNINASANGTYDYSWTVENDASLAPRTGHIIVD
jgi:hypothetical protein